MYWAGFFPDTFSPKGAAFIFRSLNRYMVLKYLIIGPIWCGVIFRDQES